MLHFSIYIHMYITFAPYSTPFPYNLPPPTGTNPPDRTCFVILFSVLFLKNLKNNNKSDIFLNFCAFLSLISHMHFLFLLPHIQHRECPSPTRTNPYFLR
jgi:hypothetical protein